MCSSVHEVKYINMVAMTESGVDNNKDAHADVRGVQMLRRVHQTVRV